MINIEFDIKINESGRPYVYLSDTYKEKPEDKFYALELATYLMQVIYRKRSENFDKGTADAMKITIDSLLMISDEYATLIKGMMFDLGSMYKLANGFSLIVENIEELYALPKEDIQWEGMLFNRCVGMKVMVKSRIAIYELVDGVENDNWMKIEK